MKKSPKGPPAGKPCAKTAKRCAEKLHQALVEAKLLDSRHAPLRTASSVAFPLTHSLSAAQKAGIRKTAALASVKFTRANFKSRTAKPRSLKAAMRGKLTAAEMKKLRRAFDTVGDIAIIEVPRELVKKEKTIAKALLEVNKSIKVVCKESGAHKGKFRIQHVKPLAGQRRLRTVHREAGCGFELELGKTYFSPRLGTERLRIARLIKPGEVVGALFAGVGPFPIVFAKNSRMAKAYAVELNPAAYKFMERNIRRNGVGAKVEPIQGDVRKIAPAKLAGKCDRVVMPLPKGGETFLRSALQCLKPKGGTVHFYQFSGIKDPFKTPVEMVKAAAEKMGKKARILRRHRVRSYSPEIVQVVVDFSAR